MIFKMTAAALTTALMLGATAPAFASQQVSEEMQAKIRTTLTEQGYEVRKVKSEDGMFEAYVVKDGKMMEVYLDAELNIVRTKDND